MEIDMSDLRLDLMHTYGSSPLSAQSRFTTHEQASKESPRKQ